ncbi:Clp protease N-terminal domain-containing protein [Saxibacter everestensis]|uniref:Clp protease N-terminal domain-containing protein n=1 Tax=Saxibacter everestensis TaxID=2909229 RepID=A0ABY8QQ68_9MICO|nr:Clp protease N-terminal domain-containing protein [Brevibacteriaceae bacterium ZFBP1038]
MFERFTTDARAIVVAAQETAREIGSHNIDSRYLLLGLFDTNDSTTQALNDCVDNFDDARTRLLDRLAGSGLDGDALASLGIDLSEVTERADAVFGSGALTSSRSPKGRIRFSQDAKKCLELALREAIRLKGSSIGTRHILLGMLRAECPARSELLRENVDVAALRSTLETQRAA